jgi:hypothetical protein
MGAVVSALGQDFLRESGQFKLVYLPGDAAAERFGNSI